MHLYNLTVAKESLWYFLCLMSNTLMIAQNTKVVRANTSMKLLLMLTVLAMVSQTLLHLFLCPFFFSVVFLRMAHLAAMNGVR